MHHPSTRDELLRKIRPIAWIPALLLIVPLIDRGIDAVYSRYTSNETFVRGRGTRVELDHHPEVEVLIIGDSSARHGLDAAVLTEELGRPTWNVGTWHGAFAGQATMISAELERGRKLSAVILMTTENGMTLPIGPEGEEVVLAYYLTPHALSLWIDLGNLSAPRVAEWSLALLSPSYRDGRGLETFALSLGADRIDRTLAKLTAVRARNAAIEREYWEGRGHGKLPDRTAHPGEAFFANFVGVLLEPATYRWRPHPEIQRWYEVLLEATDRHGVPVFHLFTPRAGFLLEHRSWARNVGLPMRRWADEVARRHPSFRYPYPDPIAVRPEDFADTSDHLGAAAAARVSRSLARLIAPMISAGTATTAAGALRPAPRFDALH